MPDKALVKDIMTSNLFSVQYDDPVKKADEIMRDENIRHIPVLNGMKLVGIITERSLIEYTLRQLYDYEDNMGEEAMNNIIEFENVMRPVEHKVYPEDSLQKAVILLIKHKKDYLPVVDWKDNLVGMLTFVDVLLFLHEKLTNETIAA